MGIGLGWFGFWLFLAIVTVGEMWVEYKIWKTKIEYGIESKSFGWFQNLFKKKK